MIFLNESTLLDCPQSVPALTMLAGTGCQILDQSQIREPNVEMIPWNTPLDYNDWDDPATPGIMGHDHLMRFWAFCHSRQSSPTTMRRRSRPRTEHAPFPKGFYRSQLTPRRWVFVEIGDWVTRSGGRFPIHPAREHIRPTDAS